MHLPPKEPHPIDIYVGARVRLRRKFEGHSQSDLANALNLTFQQVQKYERGSNRVSASKLFEIALYLKVSVAYFFEGYVSAEGRDQSEAVISIPSETISAFLRTGEGIELASAFPRIANASQRRKILSLVQTLAESGNVI